MTVASPTWVLTSLSSHDAVFHRGCEIQRFEDLKSGTDYEFCGQEVTTLADLGAWRSSFATVNDIHIGEKQCGVVQGSNAGPVFTNAGLDVPYAEMMSRGAVDEIQNAHVDLVIVKGDLTGDGEVSEFERFLEIYEDRFDRSLMYVRGNHDCYRYQEFAANAFQTRELDGVSVVLLDTATPGRPNGRITTEQIDALDAFAAQTSNPVLVFGHHHVFDASKNERSDDYFGIVPNDSDKLFDLFAKHDVLRGYFAGHTHRNNRVAIDGLDGRPFAEISAVKDFPGVWAQYEVFDRGVTQTIRRVSTPDALAWTEQTQMMYDGTYGDYSFGELVDRNFAIRW